VDVSAWLWQEVLTAQATVVRPKRKLPGWTGNALITALISAVVSGLIASAIAHQQSQDSSRQAASSQRARDVHQFETDIRNHHQTIISFVSQIAACNGKGPCLGSILVRADPVLQQFSQAIAVDLANISDATLDKYFSKYESHAYSLFSTEHSTEWRDPTGC